MRKTSPRWLTGFATIAIALTTGCEGVQSYVSESSAMAACGDDEVVYGWFQKAGTAYFTKADERYGKPWDGHTGQYACLAEMTRLKYTCGTRHAYDSGPLPASMMPACYNVPGKPKV